MKKSAKSKSVAGALSSDDQIAAYSQAQPLAEEGRVGGL